jgi:hypothetical protein
VLTTPKQHTGNIPLTAAVRCARDSFQFLPEVFEKGRSETRPFDLHADPTAFPAVNFKSYRYCTKSFRDRIRDSMSFTTGMARTKAFFSV